MSGTGQELAPRPIGPRAAETAPPGNIDAEPRVREIMNRSRTSAITAALFLPFFLTACTPATSSDAPTVEKRATADAAATSSCPELGSDAWKEHVSLELGVFDGEGHGPDLDSTEWAHAVDATSGVSDASGHGPDLGSPEWESAVDAAVCGR